MKQIANCFTLLNLLFGCIAIVYIMQYGFTPVQGSGTFEVNEQICWATLFIFGAGVVDFLDGFFARLLGASSELGKQLDSLADVVSFGVAPGMIVYQFLRLSFSNGGTMDANFFSLLPAFIIPCAGAFRLARFNISTTSSYNFKGVPIPAAGILVASLPAIYLYSQFSFVKPLFSNHWFWYILILAVSYLMVSTLPILSLKTKNFSVKKDWPKLLLLLVAVIAGIILKWFAIPVVFVFYVVLSLCVLKKE